MSLFDSASLVVTPNGVKEGKLYSIKPSDGSGDLSVVRATTATRVNSAGLVEVVPYNLLQRSEQFDNVYWTKATATISANATTAPNGTLTADKLIGNNLSTASNVNVAIVVSQGVNYNFSVYAKAAGANWIQLIATGTTIASPARLWVNLSTGALGTNNGGFLNATIENAGNGWYRISGYFTTTSTTTTLYYAPATNDNINGYNGNGTDGLFLWGGQLVEGSSAKPYYPTTDRLNIPRLDYTNGSCPSILVEPQRTNLLLRSEQFTNASWIYSGGGVSVFTDNFSISPSGNTTASRWTAANINSQVRQNVATINTTGTISVWMRTNSGTKNVTLFINDNAVQSTITVNTTWQRFTLTGATGGTLLGAGRCGFSNNSVLTTSDYIEVWGAQYEVGANATSYIPTTSASVTRNADIISKTGISSLIEGTQGSLFIECSSLSNDGTTKYFSINDGTTNKEIVFQFTSVNNTVGIRYLVGGIAQVDSSFTISNTLIFNKFLYTWQSNKFELWHNGTKIISDTLGSVTTGFDRLEFRRANGTIPFYTNSKIIAIWKTALTDDECINLTTI
jgi:hypothetical protein